MLLSNIALEVTFKCPDQNFNEKGEKKNPVLLAGFWVPSPVFLCSLNTALDPHRFVSHRRDSWILVN